MKAWVVENAGPDGRLVLQDYPDPRPGEGEVLIRVEAAAVNAVDRHLASGAIARMLGSDRDVAKIPGIDGSGTIIEVGTGVPPERVGERVVINGAVTCDACNRCAVGDNGMCSERRALGQLMNGTYAELVVVPAVNALEIPDGLSFDHAAAIPSVTLTAWQALVRRAQLQPGESVIVSAAASGVGGAAIQVAKHVGARVIAVASTQAKVDFAVARGADVGIVASPRLDQDLADALPGGADVIMDITGPSSWHTWIGGSARSGRIVTCTSDWATPPDMRGFGPRQLSLLATGPFGSKHDASLIVDLARQGTIRGNVGTVLPLGEAMAAHDLMANREVVGKVILTTR